MTKCEHEPRLYHEYDETCAVVTSTGFIATYRCKKCNKMVLRPSPGASFITLHEFEGQEREYLERR